ncbi:hypothetical protein R3P38DRAFT_330002 [Favolaschia claudopus]|uniref:Uncharacterized protein n=1 Tax=Favolaschia claudopus TaxID=2862362 RepID=A0AAV9ZM07_9AGAR
MLLVSRSVSKTPRTRAVVHHLDTSVQSHRRTSINSKPLKFEEYSTFDQPFTFTGILSLMQSHQFHLGGGVGGAGGKGGQSGGAGGKGGGPDLSPLAHWGGFANSSPSPLITAGGGRGGAGGHGGQKGGGGGFGGGVLMPNLPPQQLSAMFGPIEGGLGGDSSLQAGEGGEGQATQIACAVPGVPQDKQFLLAFPTVPIAALGLSRALHKSIRMQYGW